MTPHDEKEVEVVCPDCRLVGAPPNVRYREGWCHFCVGTRRRTVFVAPGSLDEALHLLGLAYEQVDAAWGEVADPRDRAARDRYTAALDAAAAILAEVRRLREAQRV